MGRASWAAILAAFLVGCVDFGTLSPSADAGPTATCDGGACPDATSKVPPDTVDANVPCAPGDVSSFAPTWHPPTGKFQNKCTNSQVDNYVACLFSQAANDASCRDYLQRPDNAVCGQCLMSKLDDAAYGPLIRLGPDAITVNVEGCVALTTGDATAASCAAKAQALGQCRAAACVPYCPLTDHASLLKYNDCEAASDKSSCKSYVTASACIAPLLDVNGPSAGCASGPTPLAAATAVARFFCAAP
ncbi:MAG: hypothetical protein U0235_03800 [Polyangiaceae bacterium]